MMESETTTTADAGTTTADTARLVNNDFCPTNAYATRKTVALGCLDFALLLANASQMMAVVNIPGQKRDEFFVPMITLITISIVLQVIIGIVLVILAMVNPTTERSYKRVESLNDMSVILAILITAINVFISACGISYVNEEDRGSTNTTTQPSVP